MALLNIVLLSLENDHITLHTVLDNAIPLTQNKQTIIINLMFLFLVTDYSLQRIYY